MKILLDGSWHVELEDGTTGQMDLPGTLDENGIGHRDVGANQWHPDAALGNAEEEIDKDAPIATRFTRRHTYEGKARISRRIKIPEYGMSGCSYEWNGRVRCDCLWMEQKAASFGRER